MDVNNCVDRLTIHIIFLSITEHCANTNKMNDKSYLRRTHEN